MKERVKERDIQTGRRSAKTESEKRRNRANKRHTERGR